MIYAYVCLGIIWSPILLNSYNAFNSVSSNLYRESSYVCKHQTLIFCRQTYEYYKLILVDTLVRTYVHTYIAYQACSYSETCLSEHLKIRTLA